MHMLCAKEVHSDSRFAGRGELKESFKYHGGT